MNPIRTQMPLLARNEGEWVGTYRFVTPQLEILDQYEFHILAEFPDNDPQVQYRQTSNYTWSDGRTESRLFEAQYKDEKVVWDNGRIKGQIWEIDDSTIYVTFGFHAEPDVWVYEFMQLSTDGQQRARTWHWLRNWQLYQLTLVDERRA